MGRLKRSPPSTWPSSARLSRSWRRLRREPSSPWSSKLSHQYFHNPLKMMRSVENSGYFGYKSTEKYPTLLKAIQKNTQSFQRACPSKGCHQTSSYFWNTFTLYSVKKYIEYLYLWHV